MRIGIQSPKGIWIAVFRFKNNLRWKRRNQTALSWNAKFCLKCIFNMCNRMQRFHNLSVIGMILIIAYRMGNRQVITKVPAGMLRGNRLQINSLIKFLIHQIIIKPTINQFRIWNIFMLIIYL